MNSQKNISASRLLDELSVALPNIEFRTGDGFRWSPKDESVIYSPVQLRTKEGKWALVHEAAHAKLGHTTYATDFELLQMETAAWQEAIGIAQTLGIIIREDHIQDCLDTYRDWLHKRSKCPACGATSLQCDTQRYRCHNCHTMWRVSSDRFCRPYRKRRS